MSLGDLSWTVEGREPILDGEEVDRALRAALAQGGDALRVDVVFVDDATLARMHGEFLGDPSETDVITFDLRDEFTVAESDGDSGSRVDSEGPPPEPDGELYISVDRALRVAEERGVSVARELALYVVHGALHLAGFDDHVDADRERMREAERTVMGELGYPPDDAPHDR